MRLLNGFELAGFIKQRQLHQSRALRQASKIIPRLAIIRTGDNPVIDVYMKLKQQYGEEIGVEVDVYAVGDQELLGQIIRLNEDKSVHGIIVQLPLSDPSQTDMALQAVSPDKDVDGLGGKSNFVPATAMAIDWLMSGYNVNLNDKKIAIVGRGRLVGAPLEKLWKSSGYDVQVCDSKTIDLSATLCQADIIVTATGVPGLIKSEMIAKNAVVVDAGTASEDGKIVGDVSEDVRDRDDLSITPIKGGVGPLTVAALFDNVLMAARNAVTEKK